MKQNPLMTMQSQLHSYSKVGKIIAQYILEDPDRITNSNIRQVAGTLHVSEASIVRFCRSIGLEGYSDLKISLIKYSTPQQIPSVFEEIKEGDSMETVAQNVFVRNLMTLQTAMQQIDYSAVAAASDLIRDAHKIVICGVGTSASIAENFYVHLFRAGFPATVQTDPEFMQVAAHMAQPGDLFIAISKGGRTTSVVKALEEARSHGAKTLCITAHDRTPLTETSDISIVHYAPTRAMVSTRIVQNTIADCLYICATLHRQQEVIDQIKENRRVADFLRTK